MKKTYFFIGIVLFFAIIIFMNWESYDESIHDQNITRMIEKYAFKQFFKEDPTNKYDYDITIYKSDKKEELPYNVSNKKYYSYSIAINVTEEFLNCTKGNRFDILEDITEVFHNKMVGEGTNFEGYYNDVMLSYSEWNGKEHNYDSWRMNVNGFPKELDGYTREEYTLNYYDENGKPVYEEEILGH